MKHLNLLITQTLKSIWEATKKITQTKNKKNRRNQWEMEKRIS